MYELNIFHVEDGPILLAASSCVDFILYTTLHIQGVPEKVSHSWEPKKLGTSYSETKHLLDLKLRQQGALTSTPCSQSLRPNRCVVSEYEVPNFLCSQEWDIFLGTPCSIS